MNAPNTYLQAALRRLSARLGSGLADAAATMATLAQEAPERLQQELSLFWEEVQQEADRLERGEGAGGAAGGTEAAAGGTGAFSSTQEQIDHLRARVAQLSRRLEDLG